MIKQIYLRLKFLNLSHVNILLRSVSFKTASNLNRLWKFGACAHTHRVKVKTTG